MQRLTLLFFSLVLALLVWNKAGAAAKKTPAKPQTDTSKIQLKKFDANAINRFRADKAFNYNDNAGAGQPSFWDRFWDWLWSELFGWIGRTPYAGTIMEYVLLAASAVLLAYVIFKSLGIDPINLLRGEAKQINIAYTESLENIHEINFDAEIEKAIVQNNYRLAVRMLYLKCLKQLSDSRLIDWQIDKTNAAYLNELSNPEQKQTFRIITRQFEYVWYGNFAIDKNAFGNIDRLFQNFKTQLP